MSEEMEKMDPLSIANNGDGEDQMPVGFAIICNDNGLPVLHEIPDHRSPDRNELFNINWFLIGNIVGNAVTESDDGE